MFVGPNIVTDGLVLALESASEKSYPGSGTVWYDLSGDGYFDLANGMTYNTSSNGGMVLDGTNSRASSPTFFTSNYWSENGDWTIESFHRIDGSVGVNGRSAIFANQRYRTETSNGGPGGFGLNIIGGNYCMNLSHDDGNGNTTSYEAHTYIPIVIGNDVHITYTWDGQNTTARAYKNGVLENTTINSSFKWSPRSYGVNARVGTSTQGGWGYYWPGEIYNVKVYNRALTSQEIQQNYNSQKSRFI
jgi:hypothetical protein